MMIRYAILTLALAGCATGPTSYDPSKMTAEQIKAAAGDKSATISCGTVMGPGNTGRAVYLNLDKSTYFSGAITIDQDCRVTMTTAGPQRAASAP